MRHYASEASSTSGLRKMKTPNVVYPLKKKIYSLLLDKVQVKIVAVVNYFCLHSLRIDSQKINSIDLEV
jgi:hypothetical protein